MAIDIITAVFLISIDEDEIKYFLLLLILFAIPTTYAADCVLIESEEDNYYLAKSNLPKCLDANGAQGQWEVQGVDGTVDVGPFVNGEKHGKWKVLFINGMVSTGQFVDGERHGQWVTDLNMRESASVHTMFKNGKKHGAEIIQRGDNCKKNIYENDALVDVKKCN